MPMTEIEMNELFPLCAPFELTEEAIDRRFDYQERGYYIVGNIEPDGGFMAGAIGVALFIRFDLMELSRESEWTHGMAGYWRGQSEEQVYEWECHSFHQYTPYHEHPLPPPLNCLDPRVLLDWPCHICAAVPTQLRIYGRPHGRGPVDIIVSKDETQYWNIRGRSVA